MTRRGVVTKQGIITILAVLLVFALLFGGLGAPHTWGNWGWSPAGLLFAALILVLILG